MACVVARVDARAVEGAVVALDTPPAVGLVCAVAVELPCTEAVGRACADAGPTPLIWRTRPGASATVRVPRAAYAPPATSATPSKPAAPIMVTLEISVMSLPFSRGSLRHCPSAV